MSERVCLQCLGEDEYFSQLINKHGAIDNCSYCNSNSETICFGDVAAVIDNTIDRFYIRAVEEMPRENGEWVEITPFLDTRDVIDDLILGFHDSLVEDLIDHIGPEDWCDRYWRGDSESEKIIYGWQRFCQIVKYKNRFFFYMNDDVDEYSFDIPVNKILPSIVGIIKNCCLVSNITPDMAIFRARISAEKHKERNELGTPIDKEKVRASRMNPAGIKHFYGAFDKETVTHEVLRNDSIGFISISEWAPTKELTVIDFTKLPPAPSIFDPDKEQLLMDIRFLRAFLEDIASPIEKDGAEHYDYAPTQLVSEYLRLKIPEVDGITYNSVQHDGGICLALFPQDGFDTNPEDGKLDFKAVTHWKIVPTLSMVKED